LLSSRLLAGLWPEPCRRQPSLFPKSGPVTFPRTTNMPNSDPFRRFLFRFPTCMPSPSKGEIDSWNCLRDPPLFPRLLYSFPPERCHPVAFLSPLFLRLFLLNLLPKPFILGFLQLPSPLPRPTNSLKPRLLSPLYLPFKLTPPIRP